MLANETSALIEALGGPARVADLFDVSIQAVWAWIVNDEIPASRQANMLQIVIRAERANHRRIGWRPRGWDPHIKLRYDPPGVRAPV